MRKSMILSMAPMGATAFGGGVQLTPNRHEKLPVGPITAEGWLGVTGAEVL